MNIMQRKRPHKGGDHVFSDDGDSHEQKRVKLNTTTAGQRIQPPVLDMEQFRQPVDPRSQPLKIWKVRGEGEINPPRRSRASSSISPESRDSSSRAKSKSSVSSLVNSTVRNDSAQSLTPANQEESLLLRDSRAHSMLEIKNSSFSDYTTSSPSEESMDEEERLMVMSSNVIKIFPQNDSGSAKLSHSSSQPQQTKAIVLSLKDSSEKDSSSDDSQDDSSSSSDTSEEIQVPPRKIEFHPTPVKLPIKPAAFLENQTQSDTEHHKHRDSSNCSSAGVTSLPNARSTGLNKSIESTMNKLSDKEETLIRNVLDRLMTTYNRTETMMRNILFPKPRKRQRRVDLETNDAFWTEIHSSLPHRSAQVVDECVASLLGVSSSSKKDATTSVARMAEHVRSDNEESGQTEDSQSSHVRNTREERRILKQAVEEVKRNMNIDDEVVKRILFPKRYIGRDRVPRLTEDAFWIHLYSSVPAHDHVALNDFVRGYYGSQSSEWTSEEDRMLLDLVSVRGPCWSQIVPVFNRAVSALKRRHRLLISKGITSTTIMSWTDAEDRRLIEVVKSIIESMRRRPTLEEFEAFKSWELVAERLGGPRLRTHLRDRWRNHILKTLRTNQPLASVYIVNEPVSHASSQQASHQDTVPPPSLRNTIPVSDYSDDEESSDDSSSDTSSTALASSSDTSSISSESSSGMLSTSSAFSQNECEHLAQKSPNTTQPKQTLPSTENSLSSEPTEAMDCSCNSTLTDVEQPYESSETKTSSNKSPSSEDKDTEARHRNTQIALPERVHEPLNATCVAKPMVYEESSEDPSTDSWEDSSNDSSDESSYSCSDTSGISDISDPSSVSDISDDDVDIQTQTLRQNNESSQNHSGSSFKQHSIHFNFKKPEVVTKDLEPRKGPLTNTEKQCLKDAVEQFKLKFELDEDEMRQLLFQQRLGLRDQVDQNAKKNLWPEMCQALPYRHVNTIRAFLRSLYDERASGKRWTAAEDQKLLELVATHGNRWEFIGDILNRVGRTISARYEILCRKGTRPLKRRSWTEADDQQLIDVVKAIIESQGDTATTETYHSFKQWKLTAENLNAQRTPAEIRIRWKDYILKKLHHESDRPERSRVSQAEQYKRSLILLDVVDSFHAADSTEIPWETLTSHPRLRDFQWATPGLRVRWRLLLKKVPEIESKTFQECIMWVREYLRSKIPDETEE